MRYTGLLGLLLFPAMAVAQFSTAQYTLEFESTWSETTHPDDFPPNPHFSGLIGATHNSGTTLWVPGELASDGIESMAETGGKAALESEVNSMIGAGTAFQIISGGGIGLSPGSVSVQFEANTDFPLVSVVSMIAPSPDWFVGVNGLSLRDNDEWVESQEILLYTYDSGTDSGMTYTSPDMDTQPPENIALIDGYPFFYEDEIVPVGFFRFTLDKIVSNENEAPEEASLSLSRPFPNPASSTVNFNLTASEPEFVRIDVFDVLGRRVLAPLRQQFSVGENRLQIDASSLPDGYYIVRLIADSGTSTQRIIIRQ